MKHATHFLQAKGRSRYRAYLMVSVLLVLMFLLSGCGDAGKYDRATKDLAARNYDAAIKAFTELGEYEDSSSFLIYAKALNALAGGEYALAARDFRNLQGFKSSALYASYAEARQFLQLGRYETAHSAFQALGSFEDSAQRAVETLTQWAQHAEEQTDDELARNLWRQLDEPQGDHALEIAMLYRIAQREEETGDLSRWRTSYWAHLEIERLTGKEGIANEHFYELARQRLERNEDYRSAFSILRSYTRSHGPSLELVKRSAEKAASMGQFDEAIEMYEFLAMSEVEGAKERIIQLFYAKAEHLLSAGAYGEANRAFAQAGAEARIGEPYYVLAEKLLLDKDYAGASQAFLDAGDYKNAMQRVGEPYYLQAEELLRQKQYGEANQAFVNAGAYKDAEQRVGEPHYVQGEILLAEKDYEGANKAFADAGAYKDAAQRVGEPYYVLAQLLLKEGDYTGASDAFVRAGSYRDASVKALEVHYQHAEKLLSQGKFAESDEAFMRAGDYADASVRIGKAVLDAAIAPYRVPEVSGKRVTLGLGGSFMKAGRAAMTIDSVKLEDRYRSLQSGEKHELLLVEASVDNLGVRRISADKLLAARLLFREHYVFEPDAFILKKGMPGYPTFPRSKHQHWVIYREGYRKDRVELAMFDAQGEGDPQLVWDRGITLSRNASYLNDAKYYLFDNRWIPFEQGYSRVSDNSPEVIASDLEVVDKSGNLKLPGAQVTEFELPAQDAESVILVYRVPNELIKHVEELQLLVSYIGG